MRSGRAAHPVREDRGQQAEKGTSTPGPPQHRDTKRLSRGRERLCVCCGYLCVRPLAKVGSRPPGEIAPSVCEVVRHSRMTRGTDKPKEAGWILPDLSRCGNRRAGGDSAEYRTGTGHPERPRRPAVGDSRDEPPLTACDAAWRLLGGGHGRSVITWGDSVPRSLTYVEAPRARDAFDKRAPRALSIAQETWGVRAVALSPDQTVRRCLSRRTCMNVTTSPVVAMAL